MQACCIYCITLVLVSMGNIQQALALQDCVNLKRHGGLHIWLVIHKTPFMLHVIVVLYHTLGVAMLPNSAAAAFPCNMQLLQHHCPTQTHRYSGTHTPRPQLLDVVGTSSTQLVAGTFRHTDTKTHRYRHGMPKAWLTPRSRHSRLHPSAATYCGVLYAGD